MKTTILYTMMEHQPWASISSCISQNGNYEQFDDVSQILWQVVQESVEGEACGSFRLFFLETRCLQKPAFSNRN